MPYTSKQRTRRQRQRRKAGQVKRFELVLSSENPSDYDLFEFLTTLPRGEVTSFIKSAITEKMARNSVFPNTQPDPSQQLKTILAELADLKKAVVIPTSGHVLAGPRLPPEQQEPAQIPVETISSGINLSSPRPRRDNPPKPSHRKPPDEAEFDPDEARRRLIASINAYGKEVRRGY